MKRLTMNTMMCLALSAGPALAAEAETSANAGTARNGDGFAEAGARYEGDLGFARTKTTSGQISLARGLAVGIDERGLSLSASHAVALTGGVAIARNFNLTLGRDGQVAVSGGRSLSQGAHQRSAGVSGYSGMRGRDAHAGASAFGKSDPRGVVKTKTFSRTKPKRLVPRRKLWPGRLGPGRF